MFAVAGGSAVSGRVIHTSEVRITSSREMNDLPLYFKRLRVTLLFINSIVGIYTHLK